MVNANTSRAHKAVLWASVVLVGTFAVTVTGFLVGRSGDEEAAPATTVAQLSATTPVPTTTVASTTTTLDEWERVQVLFFAGPAGDYRSGAGFFSEFKFTLPEGWARAFPELPDIVEVSPNPEECGSLTAAEDCEGLITVVDTAVPTVDETVAFFQAREELEVTEPVAAEIGEPKASAST